LVPGPLRACRSPPNRKYDHRALQTAANGS
jgi:hypothetical protein